ncbi:TolC family protein [Novosphingobium kaempferiae]|uniref:TolC family protein n=1 Tax=Novosphingobium kaempferiae TaxID=2896849 RepID=UPI001E5AE95D|nr:TolC family protein [Novosphingobium kaempferiae]
MLLLTPAFTRAMTIEEAVATAILNHPSMAAAASEAKAAHVDVDVAKAGYLPSLSASGGPRDVTPDEWAYEVTAAQMIYDWGQTRSKVRGARATERQRQEEWLIARDEAALDVIETYLDVLLYRRQCEVDQTQIGTLEDLDRMTRLRTDSGYADRSEPDRTALELARARQRLASDQGMVLDSVAQFDTLVGAPAEALVEPAPAPMLGQIDKTNFETLIEAAPLYRKAVEATNHARAQYDEARSSILPRVNVEATALSREIGGRMQSDGILALRLRVNPMQGLSAFDRTEGARQRIAAAQWNEAAARRDIERKLRNLTTNGAALVEQARALERQVVDAAQLSQVYREQFEVGRRDIVDLVTIQREHFDARRSLNDVRLQLIRIQYRLAAQLGCLADLVELPTEME